MSKFFNKGLIPVAYSISSYGDKERRKIIFKCPKCGTSFRYYEEKEKFCHNCGQKINWKDVRANYVIGKELLADCFNNYKAQEEVIQVANRFNNNKSLDKTIVLKDNKNGN